MATREVVGRYKGSTLGLIWSFINPLVMLAVYTFVFSVVFQARWGETSASGGREEFALVLFTGLIVHGFFAEILNKAPTIILDNSNYVKKVVFPLETLSIIHALSALFHTLISLCILIIAIALVYRNLHWTLLLTPLIFTPLLLLSLGCSWVLSSFGVFLRDTSQFIAIITTILLFVSPVFFPLSAIPEPYQIFVQLNPLTYVIEVSRDLILWGKLPNWTSLLVYWTVSTLVLVLGFSWFQKTRNAFADVI